MPNLSKSRDPRFWNLWIKSGGVGRTFAPTLLCATCAAKSQKKNIDNMDASGRYFEPKDTTFGKMRTDQIGWYVPCVPTEDGIGYWGYTSVPETGVRWWEHLPNRAPVKLVS